MEQYANNAASTISGNINNSSDPVTFGVTSAGAFPTVGNFRVKIGSEILLVTSVSGSNFTASRAQEGTAIASHSTSDVITQVLTKASILKLTEDGVAYGAFSSRPSAGRPGRIYIPNNGICGARDDGTNWVPFGPCWAFTRPDITSWSWMNQGSYGTVASELDGVLFGDDGGQTTTDEFRFYYGAIPSPSGQWTFTCAFIPNMFANGSGNNCGIAIGNSADDKVYEFVAQFDADTFIGYNVITGSAGTPIGTLASTKHKGQTQFMFLRIKKTATDFDFYVSKDFRHWRKAATVAHGSSYVGSAPDRFGFCMNNYNTAAGERSDMFVLHSEIA